MPCTEEIITLNRTELQEKVEKIRNTSQLAEMIMAAWELGLWIAKKIVEQILEERASRRVCWQNCPECGAKLDNKGRLDREMKSIIGTISWRRKVGRCPNHCQIGQIAPLDDELGIKPDQRVSTEVQKMSCALAVFVPYEIAAMLLSLLTKVCASPVSIWQWVQKIGHLSITKMEEELASGRLPDEEAMTDEMASLPLVLGGDGVLVPFRPYGGSPHGKTRYRQVLVGIVARLKQMVNRRGRTIVKIVRKRLVAVLNNSDSFGKRLWLEAWRQRITYSYPVVWISDGGYTFWNIFRDHFAHWARGVLDFYHAVQNVWKAASAWLDGRTKMAHQWLATIRHLLRYGQPCDVLRKVHRPLIDEPLSDSARKALENLLSYLQNHYQHIHYSDLKARNLPIGSGMVESACKWLIQQRFKGVGMRWSVNGFNHLLQLRLAWVNERFDEVFSNTPRTR